MKIKIYFMMLLFLFGCKNNQVENSIDIRKNKNVKIGIQVSGGKVRRLSIPQYIHTTAVLSAFQKGDITSEVSTTVNRLKVQNGEHISVGDTIIILNWQIYQFELEKSRGDFIKATNEFISELKLSDSKKAAKWEQYLNKISHSDILPPLPNSLSKNKMMSIVRFNLHTHYNQVKKNERQVENCVIKAPFSGIISDILVFPGAHVSPGTALFTLTDISQMNIKIDVLESDLSFIYPGTSFEFINESQVQYTVSAIHPMINPDTRSGKVLAVVSNADNRYKDGQKEMVRLEKQVFEDRLVISREAVLTRNDRDLVFVVKNGIAKWQYVKTGVGNSEYLEIIEGVSPGDTVVTSGHYSLAHDVPVEVTMNSEPENQ